MDPQAVLARLAAGTVREGWKLLLADFFAGSQGQELLARLAAALDGGAAIYPPDPLRILREVDPQGIRIVILGQDPYHGPGQAEGFAFSVAPGVRQPPSLKNIFKEISRDLGIPVPAGGSLLPWVRQGVLLLNTVLTVEDGKPASHAGWGWEALTGAILEMAAQGSPKVFMLWGAHAQKHAARIGPQHLVLMSNHPSPLAARRPPVPFIGCGHFSRANEWLGQRGIAPIDWRI